MHLSDYTKLPADIPVLVEDKLFLYPFMITPLILELEEDIKAIELAMDKNSLILVCASKEGKEGSRKFKDIYKFGVLGTIMRRTSLPDNRVKVLFQGLAKGKILKEISDNPLIANVDLFKNAKTDNLRIDAIFDVVKEKVRTLSNFSDYFQPELLRTIEESDEPLRIADLISSCLKLKKEEAYELFVEEDLEKKYLRLVDFLMKEIEIHKLQKEIRFKVGSKIEKVNREYFLKEQLKEIQKELGTDNQKDEEITEYKKKLEAKKKYISQEAYKELSKQIERFSRMHPDSSDASIVQNYLEWALDIPFGDYSKAKLKIQTVKNQLNKDHFSLDKPKDRIVEYFAVKQLLEQRGIDKNDSKGAILCFIGPPGVGKTSLANSISKALKRPLIRIALGGLEDVNELRGHRRTYIGAMPGRIVQGLIEAKKMNPVIVLDEIDKTGRNYRGDPSSVLLEILDPEQNHSFRDYYLNFDIDLSKSIFVATANDISTIPIPLKDRMEIIELSSYTPQEKEEIAKSYLVPQELKKHGLKSSELSFSKKLIQEIIHKYTREAGVRNLRRRIADIARKSAKIILMDDSIKKVNVGVKNIKDFLDKTVFEIDKTDRLNFVGVVNGLAYTPVGGDVLKIEVIKIEGKGTFEITGSLGDVMKESAKIAYSVIKNLIDSNYLKVEKRGEKEIYRTYDLHIHVPDGATPKDGPSAGITMATAIASIFTNKKVRSNIAMTGEISLRGMVMPIGGLKEKLIAGHKAGINKVLIPKKNFDRDLDDIPKEVLADLEIVAVNDVKDVLKEAFVD